MKLHMLCASTYSLFCLKKAFFLRSLVFSQISTTCVHFTCEEGGLVVSESNLLSIMSSHQKSKVNLGQVVPHYQCSKVSKLDSKLMQKRKGLLWEGFKKSKWKFKMTFAMEGGGVSRGSRVPHTYSEI